MHILSPTENESEIIKLQEISKLDSLSITVQDNKTLIEIKQHGFIDPESFDDFTYSKNNHFELFNSTFLLFTGYFNLYQSE